MARIISSLLLYFILECIFILIQCSFYKSLENDQSNERLLWSYPHIFSLFKDANSWTPVRLPGNKDKYCIFNQPTKPNSKLRVGEGWKDWEPELDACVWEWVRKDGFHQARESKQNGRRECWNDEEQRARWIGSNGNVRLFSHLTDLRCRWLNYKSAMADRNIISEAFYLHCWINSRAKLWHLCKGRQNMHVAVLKYNVQYPHSSSHSDCRSRSKHHCITYRQVFIHILYIFSTERSTLHWLARYFLPQEYWTCYLWTSVKLMYNLQYGNNASTGKIYHALFVNSAIPWGVNWIDAERYWAKCRYRLTSKCHLRKWWRECPSLPSLPLEKQSQPGDIEYWASPLVSRHVWACGCVRVCAPVCVCVLVCVHVCMHVFVRMSVNVHAWPRCTCVHT